MTKHDSQVTQPWRTLTTTYPFRTPWFKVRQDQVRTHSNEQITYTYHEHPGCALIVALTMEIQVVLLRHYRYPVRSWCWEIPAGRLDDGVNGLTAAQRELREEAGGESESWQFVGTFYTSTGSSSEKSEVYLATDVLLRNNQPEPTELLRLELVPWKVAIEMAQAGQISDGPSALALFLCQPYIT